MSDPKTAALAQRWRWLPRRRTLRMTSGLVLFAYVAVHLINHALGLISLAVAEVGLAVAVRVWHSTPGTLLLYSSATVHVVLAFYAIYERRTLRLPVIEWIRIIMGFGMPVLLVGHVIATRGAFEVYGLAPEYGRVINSLWSSGNEWLQLGLLAPGWIHGCLGLHIAFGHRSFYRRSFLLWFSLALLVPVLSGLGFLMMSKEVLANPPKPAPIVRASAAGQPREGIRDMRQTALNTYLLLFGLLLCARGARQLFERQQRSLVRVSLPGRSFSMPKGWTVLEGMRSHGIKHQSACGGRGRCSTCRIRVVSGLNGCPTPAGVEYDLLERTADPGDVRLACQLRPVADVQVTPLFRAEAVQISAEQAAGRRFAGAEGIADLPRTVLLIRLERARPTHSTARLGMLPDDARFVLRQMIGELEPVLRQRVVSIVEFGPEYLILSFDQASAGQDRSNQLLNVLRRIEDAVASLEARVGTELGLLLWTRLIVHHGPVLVSSLGVGDTDQSLVFGATASVLRQAALHPDDSLTRWLVSEPALEVLNTPGAPTLGEIQVVDAAMFGETAETLTRFFAFASIQLDQRS